MNPTQSLLEAGQSFDRMGITTDHLDFDKFSANMKAISPASAQGSVNRALYATIASLQAQLKNAKSSGSGQDAAKRAIAESEYSIYLNISRATKNITATTTIGNYVAGKPIPLPYVLFGYNDINANYSSSLKNVNQNLQAACPGIGFTVTNTAGTQVWTWTYSGNTDVVTISYAGTVTSYVNIVTNQSQSPGTFYCDYVNYVISDAVNGAIQGVQEDIQFVNISSGGSSTSAEILPNSLKTMTDFLADRWDVFIPKAGGKKLHFDANLAVVGNIIACPATDVTNGIVFTVQYNMFCDHHETHKSHK